MSGDLGTRRLLPQSSQMQNFSFAPTNFGPRENQKSAQLPNRLRDFEVDIGWSILDYVFVDEHNRHKRLKGMKALDHARPITDII